MTLKLLDPDDFELLIARKKGVIPPCPFCGSYPIMRSSVNDSPQISNGPIYQSKITCRNYKCFGSILNNARSLSEAQSGVIEKWTKRVSIDEAPTEQTCE